MTKILPASPEEVFDLWLDAESMKTWMCPDETSVAAIELNAQVGGSFIIDMRRPDGTVLSHTGEYLHIQRPGKLVFTWASPMTHDQATVVTIRFFPHDDGCRLELVQEQLPDQRSVDNHRHGWRDILQLLEHVLRSAT